MDKFMAKNISNKVTIKGEARILPKKEADGFQLINEENEQGLNFDDIAKRLYFSGRNYSYNTKIKYKIIIDRVNK